MQGFIGMLNEDIIVQKSLLPFKQDFETLHLENCKTIQEIVDKLVPFNFVDTRLVVTLNNEVVESDKWDKPLEKGALVGLNFIPTGGGGDGKNPLATVVNIIAAIAVVVFAPQAIPALAGWMGVSQATAAAIYYIGSSLVISVANTALMSAPKQNIGYQGAEKESQSQFIEGASNAINKYGVIPVNLGTNRMFPPQAALPYTETSGNDQYARQIFTFGYGKIFVSDEKIGETKLEEFTEVETNKRFNADLNQGVELYANDVYQESLNVKLTKEEGYVIRTTQKDCNECELDITFQGLAYFNDWGGRDAATVEFQIQYAPTGTENWSIGIAGFETVNPQVLNLDLEQTFYPQKKSKHNARTNTFIILNTNSGYIHYEQVFGQIRYGVIWPKISNDDVVLGYILGEDGYNPLRYVDNRRNLVGTYINSINDFVVNVNFSDYKNVVVNVGTGKIKGVSSNLKVTDATSQVLRKVKRIKFPSTGQYDVRIRRLTDDSTDDKLRNDSYLTAVRSITYANPVNFPDISGIAMRIKATDQLNGTVSSYNAVVTTLMKKYNPTLGKWEDDQATSNPADIFRYVLQSPAFAKHGDITDDKIDLEKLQEWWVYCNDLTLTYDRVIDYDTSIDDVLNDICAAGVATLSKVNNVYSVIIDNERPIIKGLVTPRNSWDYSGNINYPEIPHALRIEFRNEEAGYETDERIVYNDGYDEKNATLYERLQFESCTDASLAYWYGRRYFATALLQPETHMFKMDFENLTFNRGDRINLVNDVILVGVGQGRITSLTTNSSGNVIGFKIDDILNIPQVNNLGVRIRDNAGKGINYYLLKPVSGEVNSFDFSSPINANSAPVVGSLCAFVEDGKELDLIVTQIKPGSNQSATITAIDYAPARFNPIGEIPPFESNITIAPDLYKPYAPELAGEIQTDESVMIRNSDGSVTSVMIIPLINRNEANILPIIRVKRFGTTDWYVPTALKKDANEVILTGLQDGVNYDVEVRYQRQTGLQLLSDALLLKGIKFIGGSGRPKKVQNFRVTIMNGMGLFEWAPNDDIDISHYVIRYSASTEDVTWESAQVVMDKITSTSITNIIHKGVYLIKAVDMLGNISEEPTVIFSNETGTFKNVVEELIQQPDWLGVKENVYVGGDNISLDIGQSIGYYYFEPDVIDLGQVYECSLTANVRAEIRKRDRIRDVAVVRDVAAIRDIGKDINTDGDWSVELQMSLSDDGVTWSEWSTFIAAKQQFRACKFRIKLYTNSEYITPQVSIAQVTVDMPDRYETGEDIQITDANTGVAIQYENPFWNNPAVNITLQDAAIDDKIEYIEKNNQGFTIKVFNGTLNSYVTRSFDYLAAGYGKALGE